ncbi:Rne/Rng family ribonuclease [Fictibacillus nanhaiensis]|uniref:Rne/Rng family ribonuclease n=1 Tax=Fictibacillus nanhaiensis TaxID=742169 RepID=UPI001C96456B|nr:Rne/Rng family ribonuclease [Fictibacillus nanhaiensis]MBY6035321.1 Rne/Rng family ribonuclease [Fictibacillus nanhaiensis]
MQQVVINAAGMEKRTALLHNGKLVECAYQRPTEKPSTGSIYKGRVQKVLPGMQAVFVDIGTDKNGFLHKDDLPAFQVLTDEEKKKTTISSLIKEGESVLVQIAKEESGDKGAKLTALLSFTGHLLVYFPFTSHIGVSKKIQESNRETLLRWGSERLEPQEGLIIRTGCEEFPEKEMNHELMRLKQQYSEVKRHDVAKKAPALIIRPPFYQTYLERWLNQNVEDVIVDDHETYLQIKDYISTYRKAYKVKLYHEKEPIFKKYGIDVEIQKSLSPHVWLKNGSSLYWNATEALTVVDVNTGKFTGKKDRAKTVVETNLLAAKEIMRQLRLRNLAGMIVIDFITMESKEDKQKITLAMQEEIKKDSSTMILHGFTKMGLFEMTRKKDRPSLLETLAVKPRAEIMDGHILRSESYFYELERIAHEYSFHDDEALWIEGPDYFVDWLQKNPQQHSSIENQYGITLFVTAGSINRNIIVRQTGTKTKITERMLKESD